MKYLQTSPQLITNTTKYMTQEAYYGKRYDKLCEIKEKENDVV